MSKDEKNIFDEAVIKTRTHETRVQIQNAKKIAVGKIITLCGSTYFKYEYLRINMILTLAGNTVLSCGVFKEDFSDIEKYRDMLENIHKRKIDMSDMIFVINCNDFIGEHTKLEIEYAEKAGKDIKYLYNDKIKVL